jgi:chromosome segregation ATPase
MKHSQGNGDTKHIDALYDSLQTELNLQDHLKKMIEKMNARRLKQDQEIDVLCEKIASMESTSIQNERDKMVLQNQKRLIETEKQDLVDKVAKLTKQLQDESGKIQRLEVEMEQKKGTALWCEFPAQLTAVGAYSALNKAYEMNKNTLEQLKRKDSMIKRHVGQQDSEILKVKSKMSEQEKQMKNLRDELQVFPSLEALKLTPIIEKERNDPHFDI